MRKRWFVGVVLEYAKGVAGSSVRLSRELHMASGFSILLEPILRRTSYQDRKYDVQADARRGSIDVTGRLAPERTRWYSSVKTALSTALTVLCSGAGKYCDMVVKGSRPYVEA